LSFFIAISSLSFSLQTFHHNTGHSSDCSEKLL